MRWVRRVGVVLGLAVVLASCGSDGNDSAKTADATTTTTAAAAPAAADATVKVATSDEYGKMLVDADGRTLYLFEKDQGTTSACTGACVDNWPAFTATAPKAGDGVDQAKLSTAAADQVVYNGHLLYHFAGDKAAGDMNGAGIPSWYPVDPSGAAIDKD